MVMEKEQANSGRLHHKTKKRARSLSLSLSLKKTRGKKRHFGGNHTTVAKRTTTHKTKSNNLHLHFKLSTSRFEKRTDNHDASERQKTRGPGVTKHGRNGPKTKAGMKLEVERKERNQGTQGTTYLASRWSCGTSPVSVPVGLPAPIPWLCGRETKIGQSSPWSKEAKLTCNQFSRCLCTIILLIIMFAVVQCY